MTVPARQDEFGSVESVLARGDLSKLTEQQRTDYYLSLCKSLGLNPLTQPFEYLNLNGKLVLYAKRACADQLRKINGISLKVISQDMNDGLLTVHVSAKDKDGREDEDLGVVNFPDTLRGDARANAILKAVTKAKRRVTLSISGLGFLDETEVDDIPTATVRPAVLAPNDAGPGAMVNTKTGEIIDGRTVQAADAPLDWIAFGKEVIEALTKDPHSDVEQAQGEKIAQMKAKAPKVHARMVKALAKLKQPQPKDDPEAYLAWLREKCAAVADIKGLEALQASQADVLKTAFPPDADQAVGIMAARAREIAECSKLPA